MTTYSPPVSIIFVWHPADLSEVKPIVDYCSSLLSRDINKPFSRFMNLPIFYRTVFNDGIPSKLPVQSVKTVIFPFVGKNIAADEEWVRYIENLPTLKNIHIVPIALDNTAFSLKGALAQKNFIRAYYFEPANLNEYMFIYVTHEIYRFALNESFAELTVGKNNALKLFLSHAKDGRNGIKLAKALKEFIDNSAMRNFFDATDIAYGYRFDEEIVGHIMESTLIAIHSDDYSSRYWCQREILCAKEYDRPIIAVDTIEEFEDRRFPFASNIPGVHVHLNGDPSNDDLLRILCSALLETVRFFYAKQLLNQFRQAGWIGPDVEIRARPPEVSDIEKILVGDKNCINFKHRSIVYPEPPLYSEELLFLSKLGVELNTPLTINSFSLQGKNVGLSISELSLDELIAIGQSSSHLVQLSQDIARHLLTREAILTYGGDLRENGFTEFILNEAQVLQTRLNTQKVHLNNFIAWPIYLTDTPDVKLWKAKYRPIASMHEVLPPADTEDLIPDKNTFLLPEGTQNLFVWSRCLTEMRNKMIEACDIRICAGGKYFGYKGRMPGVLEELIIAVEKKHPLFLLGGFGGITAGVCKFLETGILPQEFTRDWQIQNNPGYKELLEFFSSRGNQYTVDYCFVEDTLRSLSLNNGLSQEDNIKLFHTPFVEEAVHLVFKGLKSMM